MDYKNYIPTAERHDLYSHAIQHSALASKELFFDVQKMINHIEFMHEDMTDTNFYLHEVIEECMTLRSHPFRNLWRWACNLIDKVITS
jgi:hypothetical protein